MGKDPAFLFYPGDWLGGTLGMSFEEKGAYMELLMLQFNRGHMTSHMIGQTVGQLWDKLKDKFAQDDKGLWFNKRLEEEQNKRKTFTVSRKNNLKGENQYSKRGQVKGHMTPHMENENENENVIINTSKKETKKSKVKDHLFFDSEFYDLEKFEEQFKETDYQYCDLKIYHEKVKNWSASKGMKRQDWIATARNFMIGDKEKGKLILRPGISQPVKGGKFQALMDQTEMMKELNKKLYGE